jgi:hypothetical protein
MSSTSLGRIENAGQYWLAVSDERLSDRIQITDTETISKKGVITDYPFEGQKVRTGKLIYQMKKWKEPDTVPTFADFQYRTQSGLFIIIPGRSNPSPDKLVREINDLMSEDSKISPIRPLPRTGLFDFISNADQISEIVFVGPEGVRRWSELQNLDTIDKKKYSIRSAELVFDHDGRQIIVDYSGGTLNIPQATENGREYIIQRFERDVLSR